jgi:hypothetical protein
MVKPKFDEAKVGLEDITLKVSEDITPGVSVKVEGILQREANLILVLGDGGNISSIDGFTLYRGMKTQRKHYSRFEVPKVLPMKEARSILGISIPNFSLLIKFLESHPYIAKLRYYDAEILRDVSERERFLTLTKQGGNLYDRMKSVLSVYGNLEKCNNY